MGYADIIKKKQKEWNAPEMMEGSKANRGDKLPFSSPLMNFATYGGIPRYKMTEFHGEYSGGKTTTAVDICKNAIEIFKKEFDDKVADMRNKVAGGKKELAGPLEDLIEQGPQKTLYVDLEHSFDEAWSKTLGIADSDIEVMQPPDIPAEDILQMIEDIVETGEVGLIVLDSVPSLVPKAELEKKFGERTVAALAGLLTIFCRKIVPKLTRYKCTLLVINQVRENMDNPYVIKTPGGEALKFYSCLRIYFRIGSPVDFLGNELPKSAENPAGYIVNAKIIKQKSAPHDRKLGSYYLMAQSGLRPDFDFAQLAVKKYGIIRKSGGWYTMCDPYTGEVLETASGNPVKVNGMAKVYEYLQAETKYYKRLCKYIVDDINGFEPEEPEDAEEQLDLEDNPEDSQEAIPEVSTESEDKIAGVL